MNRLAKLFVTGILGFGWIVPLNMAHSYDYDTPSYESPQMYDEVHHDRAEIHHERKDLRQDRHELRKERRWNHRRFRYEHREQRHNHDDK
jgi:hypothetical protein